MLTDFCLTCDGPAPSRTDAVDRWFEEKFWDLYPRKVKKQDALKWCRKHAKSASAQFAIIRGLEVWCMEFRRRDLEYVPYPGTWLRSEAWHEESWPAKPAKAPRMSALERMIASA